MSQTQEKLFILKEMVKLNSHTTTDAKQKSFISNQSRLQHELEAHQKDYGCLRGYFFGVQNQQVTATAANKMCA